MRIVQFQVPPKAETIIVLMEDGRMFFCDIKKPAMWFPIELPEHPMGLPKNPLGPPPEDKK